MAGSSNIEWCDSTWNPIVGCSIVSPGCTNCYAMRMAARIEKMTLRSHYDGTTQASKAGPVWTGKIARAQEDILTVPLRWKKPRRIFVNSMGDLFHESIPDEWIDHVFAVMALCPQHTFQVLTKRAERMWAYVSEAHRARTFTDAVADYCVIGRKALTDQVGASLEAVTTWPLTNVWLGVSAERQEEADERIPHLLATPAAIRFVSAEPLLGQIDLEVPGYTGFAGDGGPVGLDNPRLDWIIVGGESGPHARPMHPDWARSIRDQCSAAGMPFFFKQWGEYAPCENDQCEAAAQAIGRLSVVTTHGVHLTGERVLDHDDCDAEIIARFGKRGAGRMLDGREWNEFPVIEGVVRKHTTFSPDPENANQERP